MLPDVSTDKDESTKLRAPGTAAKLQKFAELREVRGFYPRLHLVAPETLALMQAASAATVAGASSPSLDVLLDNMKAGERSDAQEPSVIYNSSTVSNFAFMQKGFPSDYRLQAAGAEISSCPLGVVIPTCQEEIWGSGNFAMHGACGAMRAALIGKSHACQLQICLQSSRSLLS